MTISTEDLQRLRVESPEAFAEFGKAIAAIAAEVIRLRAREEAARAEEEARAKRAADAAHRARIQAAIAEALEAYMQMGAMGVADAIIGGAIPHVKVAL